MVDKKPSSKIGYVLKMYPRFSETFIVNEILELERRGMDIHIFSLKRPKIGRFHTRVTQVRAEATYLTLRGSAPVLRVHRRLLLKFRGRYLRALLSALSRRKRSALTRFLQAGLLVDQLHQTGVAHLHAHFASTATRVAMFAHLISGIPYSFTAHAKDIFLNNLDSRLLKQKISLADFVVTVSHFNKSYLTGLCGEVVKQKVRVVYNGIDLTVFRPNHRAEREESHILGVGRLVEKKGFTYLVEACRILREWGVDFRCEIVGYGPERPLLKSLIERYGLGDAVSLKKAERHSELVQRLRKATVFALPCVVAEDGNKDALPTVLLESMAVGLPVISTDLTGIPEIIDDGKTGLVVPQNDALALADALKKLLSDAQLRARLAVEARKKVERQFEVSRNAGVVYELLLDSLRRRGQPLEPLKPTAAPSFTPEGKPGLRVIYVCADMGIPLLGSKGSSVHVREFVRALRERGNQVEIVVARLGEGDKLGYDIPVWELTPEEMALRVASTTRSMGDRENLPHEFYCLQMNSSLRRKLKGLLKRQKWDVIYERYSLWSFVGAQLAQNWGIPYLLEVNSPLPMEQEVYRGMDLSVLAHAIEKELFTAADGVFAVSEELRRYAIDRGASRQRTFVIPNGVDPRVFDPDIDGGYVREKLNIGKDDFVVGFVGSIKPWHGIDILVDAFRELSLTRLNWRLLIVGDGPLRDWTQKYLKKNCLEDRAVLAGKVPHHLVPTYIASMDVTVAPYPPMDDFYFSPLKIFEYAAMAKPIVASAQGQPSDVIENHETGLLYAPGDRKGLMDCLTLLSRNKELRLELGQRARKMVLERHSWDGKVKRVVEIASMLGERQSPQLYKILGHPAPPISPAQR